MTFYLVSAIASFIYVFLRAMQQLNVVHDRHLWVVPTSIAMGICDVVLILLIVKTESLWMGVTNGIGAGIGAILAMILHKRMRNKK